MAYTGPTQRELTDPLWLAIFRRLGDLGMGDQVTTAYAASELVDAIRRTGLKMVPDMRYGKWRDASVNGVPREGDLAFYSGWAPTCNPFDMNTVANRRWTADWYRAAADAYEDHVHGHEGTDLGEKELKRGD